MRSDVFWKELIEAWAQLMTVKCHWSALNGIIIWRDIFLFSVCWEGGMGGGSKMKNDSVADKWVKILSWKGIFPCLAIIDEGQYSFSQVWQYRKIEYGRWFKITKNLPLDDCFCHFQCLQGQSQFYK